MTELNNLASLMFIANGLLAVVTLLMAFILNGMRASFKEMSVDLKKLNNAVLGEYAKRDELKVATEATHKRIHDLRGDMDGLYRKLENQMQAIALDLERHGVQLRRRSDVAGPPG